MNTAFLALCVCVCVCVCVCAYAFEEVSSLLPLPCTSSDNPHTLQRLQENWQKHKHPNTHDLYLNSIGWCRAITEKKHLALFTISPLHWIKFAVGFTEGHSRYRCFLFITDLEKFRSESLKVTCLNDGFASNKHRFSLHKTTISCLDSHSDGTHSLQRIHWWTSDVMLHFSKFVLMKKQTHLHLWWPEVEWMFREFSFLDELIL